MSQNDPSALESDVLRWIDDADAALPDDPATGSLLRREARVMARLDPALPPAEDPVVAALAAWSPVRPGSEVVSVRAVVVLDLALLLLLLVPGLTLGPTSLLHPFAVALGFIARQASRIAPLADALLGPATAAAALVLLALLIAAFVRGGRGFAGVLLLSLLPLSAPSSAAEIVRLGGDARLAADEEATGVVVIWGDTTVLGHVRGDVVALLGDVEVHGTVDGATVVIFGDLRLGPAARVLGDRVLVGGEERGLGHSLAPVQAGRLLDMGGTRILRAFRVLTAVSTAAFASISAFLLLALWPERVRNLRRTVEASPGSSLLMGGLLGFGLLTCLLLLAWTLVGFLAWPLVGGLSLVLWAAGVAGIAEAAGERLPLPSALRNRGTHVVLGSLLLGTLLGLPWAWGGWPSFFGLLAAVAVSSLAVGAAILSVLGARPYGA